MKKIIAVLGTAAAIFAAQTVGAADVFVNSVPVGFNDSVGYPFIENGRMLVPLRASMEALGAEVSWDGANNTAVVRKGTTTVACVIGENCVYRNGTKIVNDAAAVIRGSRTYLPIRVVAEALDAEVGPGVPYPGNLVAVREKVARPAGPGRQGSPHAPQPRRTKSCP